MMHTRGNHRPLAAAMTVGRKRRRRGQVWPMPVRKTDLGHIYTEATIRPMASSRKKWTGRFLVETGATDAFLPSNVLRKLGIKPIGQRSYEMADGTELELPIGLAAIEVKGQTAGGMVVFAGENDEPLLGVTVLESAGFWIDPQRERLIPRAHKRKYVTWGVRRTPSSPHRLACWASARSARRRPLIEFLCPTRRRMCGPGSAR